MKIDFSKLLMDATDENVAKYREEHYLETKYMLLNNVMVGVQDVEVARKKKEEIKAQLEVIFSADNLSLHKPEYNGIDLTDYLTNLLLVNVYEELMIIVIDTNKNEVLDSKTFTDQQTGSVGSVRLNRDVVTYLISAAHQYGPRIGFIQVHNHPGCVKVVPSQSDHAAALNIASVGRFIGVPCLDVMIITDFDLYSATQQSILNNEPSLLKRNKAILSKEEIETLDSVDKKFKYLWNIIPMARE